MMIELDEMKGYLRVDHDDDDALISQMISASEKQCLDILRTDDEQVLTDAHREDADHNALNLTLRALLFGDRKVGF